VVSRASGGGNTEGLRRHACGYEDQTSRPGRRITYMPTQAMILLYLHTVKDGSGDDRVACLFKVNASALVKSKSSLGLDLHWRLNFDIDGRWLADLSPAHIVRHALVLGQAQSFYLLSSSTRRNARG